MVRLAPANPILWYVTDFQVFHLLEFGPSNKLIRIIIIARLRGKCGNRAHFLRTNL